ncbi:uncharacterized protein LOC120896666 isoform X2 [Anopheles arabiensis]|uniref:uncharacterized protein LOC120896666 isoform X2 n=1 Tax=Anopheles arabiensis TaxID=7173 RepID=UPI001AAD1075|nr:uncharacterized protein LOC120896666 isoform X2 [Anopheles arabiensis]XP_040156900.1 uncharacterized protein LOC120896666 isoform X2 [Anopheles arabiensis]
MSSATLANFSITQRGRPLLVHEGYSYIDNLGSGSIDSMIFVSLPLKNKIVRKIYHNGFYYCRSKCIYGTTYWVCDRAKQDNCRSRITTFDDKRTYKVTNPVHNHNHCLRNSFSVSHDDR